MEIKDLEKILGARDKSARYYKPLCVFAVCELLNYGRINVNMIEAIPVLEKFDELISLVIPSAVGKGFSPFWHLGTPKFWQLHSAEGTPVTEANFRSGKPKTRRQLELEISYAIPSKQVLAELNDSEKRISVVRSVVGLLLREKDDSSRVVGAVLQERLLLNAQIDMLTASSFLDPIDTDCFSVEDYSRLRVHEAVDRISSKKVKDLHGYTCAMCHTNLEEVYGEVGRGYIEAHHLKPVAENLGRRVTLDLRKDFVVLCPNCHRMIHRANLPHSLATYIERFGRPKSKVF